MNKNGSNNVQESHGDGWDEDDWSFDDPDIHDEGGGTCDFDKSAGISNNNAVNTPTVECSHGEMQPSRDTTTVDNKESPTRESPSTESKLKVHSMNEREIARKDQYPNRRRDDQFLEMESYLLREIKNYSSEIRFDSKRLKALMSSNFERVANNVKTAEELTKYYHSRPNLKEYTFEKELPRMKYTVITHDGNMMSTNEEIRTRFFNHTEERFGDDILWRAANQSLLADAISALTFSEGIVRPQFLSTLVADRCAFIVDFSKSCVLCECSLVISIPGARGNRLEMGRIELSVFYNPAVPVFRNKVESIIGPILSECDQGQYDFDLKAATSSLSHDLLELGYSPGILPGMDQLHASTNGSFQFRDAVLFDSAAFAGMHTAAINWASKTVESANRSQIGFAEALRDIDTATNFKSKFNMLASNFNNMKLLPSAEDMMEIGENYDDRKTSSQEQHRNTEHSEEFNKANNTYNEVNASLRGRSHDVTSKHKDTGTRGVGSVIKEKNNSAGCIPFLENKTPNHINEQFKFPRGQFQDASGINRIDKSKEILQHKNTSHIVPPESRAPLIGGFLIGGLTKIARAATQPSIEEETFTLYRSENKKCDDEVKQNNSNNLGDKQVHKKPLSAESRTDALCQNDGSRLDEKVQSLACQKGEQAPVITVSESNVGNTNIDALSMQRCRQRSALNDDLLPNESMTIDDDIAADGWSDDELDLDNEPQRDNKFEISKPSLNDQTLNVKQIGVRDINVENDSSLPKRGGGDDEIKCLLSEDESSSSSFVKVDMPFPSCSKNAGSLDGDICETRKRWIRPRRKLLF